ncbi:MAG: hypothetical protein ABJC66_02375 [Gammaproteobacteria bacterium]
MVEAKVLRCLLVLCIAAGAQSVHAQTDEIQVYDAAIAAPGQLNLTLHNNFTVSGRSQPDFPNGVVPEHALNGVPEFGYGVSDWFELGAYLPVYSLTSGGHLLFDSAKLRALFVVPHARERIFFYGLNFELSYNSPHWDISRYSGEIRPIVGVHLGKFDLIFNPILDTAFEGFSKLDFAPAARVAYNVTDKLGFALEHYADLGAVSHFERSSKQSHTLFAVVDFVSGASGIEFGIGHGFSAVDDSVVVKLMYIHDL